MRLKLYLQALLSFTVVLASSSYVVHETLPAPPGYEKSHRPNPKSTIPLRIYVVQRDTHLIPDLLLNVSLPDSPHYGAHWTPQQVADTFHNGDSLHEVREWLVNNGVNSSRILVGRGAGWVGVRDATVEEAQSLLRSEYWVYKSSDGSTIDHVAPTQYSLPRHLADHVDFVLTTPPPQRKARNGPVSTVQQLGQVNISQILEQLDNCEAHTTPVCLRSLYGVVYEPQVPDKNSYGIVEYTPQAFVQSDLDIFFGNFSGDSGFRPGATPKVVGIDGGFVQTTDKGFNYNGESNLDLQYGMEMVSSKQPVTLYQVGDAQEGASFNNFLDALDASYCGGDDPNYDAVYPDTFPGGYKGPPDCGTSKPANVISTSYGYNEAELSPKYMERQCLEYAKLGLMGVTVLYSSGDSGVGGNYDTCLDDKGHESYSGKRFNPSFPSTCPWVTSVGATMIIPEASTKVTSRDSSARRYKEMACEKVIYSGGGFSNVFRMPDYQSVVVKSYLKSYADTVQYGSPAGYRWNNTGSRAFPDISANGANYVVAVNGKFSLVYGTSASAPVVGGLFTLINDARIARGKRPIGFVNPTLYHASFTKAFHDIVSGGNRGCGTPGFKAVAGWDPVTGMGTPNFAAMMDPFDVSRTTLEQKGNYLNVSDASFVWGSRTKASIGEGGGRDGHGLDTGKGTGSGDSGDGEG